MESLDDVQLDAAGVKAVQGIIKDMHFIISGFRTESIQDVTEKVCATLRRLGQAVVDEHRCDQDIDEDILVGLETAMQEASSLMPGAQGLAKSVCEINQSMRSRKHAGLVKGILEACNGLLQIGPPSEQNKDEMTKQVAVLNEHVISLQEPLPVSDDEKLVVQKTWKRLIQVFAASYLADEEEMIGMNQVTNLLFTLLHLLSTAIPSSGQLADCLTTGQQFLETVRSLRSKEEPSENVMLDASYIEALRSVTRSSIQVNHAKTTWSEAEEVCDECKQAWQDFMAKYEKEVKLFTSQVSKLQDEAARALQQACSACEKVAGGKKGGAKWTDGLKSSLKWPALSLKFKDGLLFDIKASELAATMESAVQVPFFFSKSKTKQGHSRGLRIPSWRSGERKPKGFWWSLALVILVPRGYEDV